MAQLEPLQDSIRDAGASLLYIAAEKRDGFFKPVKYLTDHPISFPFLLDEDRAVTKSYGVYHRIGVDAYNIARPATFVVGRDGLVKYLYVGSSQTDRSPIGQVLAEVAKHR
jgi:peroxiredoxin